MERCARCGVKETEVRLFDAVYEGRMNSLCERCSIIENIPIIKKPDTGQLRDAEKGYGVYSRMKRLAGIRDGKRDETFFREDRLRELETNPKKEMPVRESLNLIEHYHWEVMKNRRRKGLSHKQLAESLGESEAVLEMIEKGRLPENAEAIIRKLEQFFQVRLRKITEMDKYINSKRSQPVLLDKDGNELDMIPEPEIISGVDDSDKKFENGIDDEKLNQFEEKKEINLNELNTSRVKIGDLRELNRRRIEATRQEKIEEQKRIEERQKIIEARKEELRLMKERESKDLDKYLGGTELLGKDGISEPKGPGFEEFDEELI